MATQGRGAKNINTLKRAPSDPGNEKTARTGSPERRPPDSLAHLQPRVNSRRVGTPVPMRADSHRQREGDKKTAESRSFRMACPSRGILCSKWGNTRARSNRRCKPFHPKEIGQNWRKQPTNLFRPS